MTERTARNDEVRRPGRDPERDPERNPERDPERNPERRRPRATVQIAPLVPGLLFAGAGIVFLLDNLDLVESWQILRFWPVVLLVAGVYLLFVGRDRGTALRGTLLAGAGGLLLLNSLDLIDFSFWQLWPLGLVAIGLRMLAHARSGPAASVAATESDEVCHAFLGGVERRNRSADFRGGSASAFMGGVNLDLTQADIAGDRAVIRVFAMMGGIEIRIPEEWTAEIRVVQIMGALEDKTRGPSAVTKRLVLDGTVLMGGVEIRN